MHSNRRGEGGSTRVSPQETRSGNSGPAQKQKWFFIVALSLIIPLVAITLLAALVLEQDTLVVTK
jgi:hypothetical protein